MKILMSALVTTATLLFAQSCSTSPNSQEPIKAVSAGEQNHMHSTQSGNHQGHLVIVRQETSLTSADYIHAHAVKNQTPGQVKFMTSFPEPGLYKLWGQFNRNGEIITADFWVKAT
ncbi:hypothetical protein RIVM261_049650 [Rivularia sp. IAM M-261]|nr:hypothetical protein RIVM261_049650 [Rivularia sp. IAM M-261]